MYCLKANIMLVQEIKRSQLNYISKYIYIYILIMSKSKPSFQMHAKPIIWSKRNKEQCKRIGKSGVTR